MDGHHGKTHEAHDCDDAHAANERLGHDLRLSIGHVVALQEWDKSYESRPWIS